LAEPIASPAAGNDPQDKAIPPHPPGYRLRRGQNWFFLGLMYASYYLCRRNLSIASPELTSEFKFSNEQYGAINTGRDGGYAVGQFVNGLFADRLGGKQAMAVGALGTILMNVVFGLISMTSISWMLIAMIGVRTIDGYLQAFGAPGMVKINTSWFQRRERGRFAGIFGGMIQLGDIGVGALGKILLAGFAIPILGVSIAHQNWRSMFFVPPAITLVVVVLMWLTVKNHPEEAGYSIPHDDDVHGGGDIDAKLPMSYIFKKIASNPIAWINAGAYFCTGFVRTATVAWWTKYMFDRWHAGKDSGYYTALVWSLPIAAFVGSFSSGIISDTLFKGKRAPVGALLYFVETLVILLSIYVLGHTTWAGPLSATVLLTAIAVTCNSTHSIIGTAAAMDLGGRKMAGFAAGVIDSFQYFGAMLAGWTLGITLDSQIKAHGLAGWNALFWTMAPFSAAGMVLMMYIWLSTRGRDVKGS
jgi:OPA family glycerol-3-phosphate transporter-like MFS transporter